MIKLVKVSNKLTGKMENMTCITTSSTCNDNCAKLSQIEGSVCSKCYSKQALSYRKNVRDAYEENSLILSERIIPVNELPFINALFCRLESFGDIINENHLTNYINIIKKNPHCHFTLWTKQYKLVLDYFTANSDIPTNFTLMVSSLFLNKEINVDSFRALGLDVRSFTVYTFDYAIANNIDINCGDAKCFDCRKCYSKDGGNVNEILKQDAKKYYKEVR